MLTYVAKRITAFLVPEKNDRESELCQYGCEIWLYTVFSTIGLVALGVLLGTAFETIEIVTIFYLCQSNGGGYHASSHAKCFMTMAVGLLMSIAVLHFLQSQWPYCILLGLSLLIMLRYPICLHPNKQYLSRNAKFISNRSKIVAIGITVTIIIAGLLGLNKFAQTGSVAIACSSLSRLYAIRQNCFNSYLNNQ